MIEYSDAETIGRHTIINQMEYVEEVLSNLKPDTTYTFTITIENGVSDQDTRGKDLRSCKLILWKEVCSTKIVVYNAGLIFFYCIQDFHLHMEYKHSARLLDGGCPSIQMGRLLAMMCC